jgi:hypothetical protein
MPPGKTGTVSVRAALKEMGGDPIQWDKWQHHENGDMLHSCHLPEELKGYYVFASVRNPYTRMISTYKHVVAADHHLTQQPTQEGFKDFLHNEYFKSMWDLLGLSEDYTSPPGCVPFKIDSVIKMETLAQDFNNLPFVKEKLEFPHEHKNWFPHSCITYTPTTAQIVYERYIKDFETFEYPKEHPLIKKSITEILMNNADTET